MTYILCLYVLYLLLSWGLACALDNGIELIGWEDTKPLGRLFLPGLYCLIALYGLLLLAKKLVPRWPDWSVYFWVMVLGADFRVKTDYGAYAIFQVYNRRGPARRGKQWKRDLAARIIRLNRPRWAKQPYRGRFDW